MEEPKKKEESLKSQGAWIMFAKVIGFGFAFLLPLLVVRILTKDAVGVYRQSFQFIMNAVSILPLGISMSAYYFLTRETEKNRSATVFNILLFNFITGGLAFLVLNIYPQLLGNIYQSDEMTRLAPAIGAVIWLWIFSTFLEVVALANQESKVATVFIILAQLTKTILMAGAVLIFGTVEAFIYAAIIQGALQTVILMVYLNNRFPKFWTHFSFGFFREHLYYAMPFGFAGLLWTLQNDIHTYFVGYRFTDSEYAIYAYGCFYLPLLAILYESTTAVLIPRMSNLQSRSEKREMVELTTRVMQKLSLVYFPVYAFFLITAEVFILTLFTRDYLASVPIFLINITLLPFDIWVVDPMIRAYKELGRFLLILRVLILIGLVAALYYGIQYFDLRGMIAIVVVISIFERVIASIMLGKKLEVKRSDISLLKGIGKVALVSIFAGIITFIAFWFVKVITFDLGANLTQMVLSDPKQNLIDFISGGLTLGITSLVFAPIYIFGINYLGLIEKDEKDWIKAVAKDKFELLMIFLKLKKIY